MPSENMSLANFRWVRVSAGITPFSLVSYISLYLVKISLVNIMFWHYRLQYRSSALLYINNQLPVICIPVICIPVICISVMCNELLSVISYIYNALGVTRRACIVSTGLWHQTTFN